MDAVDVPLHLSVTSMLQCAAECCSEARVLRRVMQCITVCCSDAAAHVDAEYVLLHLDIARVLQCVAVSCSVLKRGNCACVCIQCPTASDLSQVG